LADWASSLVDSANRVTQRFRNRVQRWLIRESRERVSAIHERHL
jgi:hypothetical protein